MDASVVYFNTYDPSVANRGDFTVSLRTQQVPFNAHTSKEFDPALGRHDDFELVGPYIFAQKTDPESYMISLYVSYNRQPFQRAMIPSTDPHQVMLGDFGNHSVVLLSPNSRTTLYHT